MHKNTLDLVAYGLKWKWKFYIMNYVKLVLKVAISKIATIFDVCLAKNWILICCSLSTEMKIEN